MNIKVLHVVEAIEGGLSRHVAQVVSHVPAEHHLVLPAERVGGFTDTAAIDHMRGAGAEIHLMTMRRSSVDLRNAIATARVCGLIRRLRPDIVHGHSSIGGAVARLAGTATATPSVYTPNGVMTTRAAIVVERALGRLTDAFIAVSQTEADLAARLRIVPRERIVVIPNGIDLDDRQPPVVDPRARLGIDVDTPLVGTIARLAPQKAPEVFIRACAHVAERIPEARFVLIGEGPLAGFVSREIASTGVEDRFLHLRGLHGAATLLGQLDVFVLASRYEGGPYAPLEAMRAGTPVVLTSVTGNRDIVGDGSAGLLVPPDNPLALAGAVVRLLRDGDLRHQVAHAARKRLRDRFDVRVTGERLGELYRSVVNARRPRFVHTRSSADN
jgi:glycosyltransferase involved in cell wall biosynthesis